MQNNNIILIPDACPPNIFQIVGHTLQYDELPLRQNRVVCIDCRKAFEINDDNFDSKFADSEKIRILTKD